MYKLMSAGPTMVRENVMKARSKVFRNPDLDSIFFDEYKSICKNLSKVVHTENEAYILGGEGILGLEAACAALTEKGDRVLVIDNGIFGKGFEGFVNIYGGKAEVYKSDYRHPIDIEKLRSFLEDDNDFKYATLVHCDTPSGVLNDVEAISSMLKNYGILSVVDSVAGMFGEPINMDEGRIDILCGGSQKALSAPPGLTMMWLSDEAWRDIENRKAPIAGFYTNIELFKNYYEKKEFPYTMPASDIKGLNVAIENFLKDEKAFERHEQIAGAVRKALRSCGLKLYLESGWSNTVTVIEVPEGMKDEDILNAMKEDSGIMISGCFDVLAGKVIRIGHMGENANVEDIAETLKALQAALEKNGMELIGELESEFRKFL